MTNEPTVTIPRRHYDDLVNLAECAAMVPDAIGWDSAAIEETRATLVEAGKYATYRVSSSLLREQSRAEWEARGWRPRR